MKFIYDKKFESETLDRMKDAYAPEVFDIIRLEIEKVVISSETLERQIEFIQTDWKLVSDNFYKKLGAFYGVVLNEPDLTCYLVRFPKYPYNYNGNNRWFCAPLFISPIERRRVVMHELCHFFQPTELPRCIKEAIPVILNDHDAFMMYGNDRGHNEEDEQKWRKIVWDTYRNGGSYGDIIEIIKNGKE